MKQMVSGLTMFSMAKNDNLSHASLHSQCTTTLWSCKPAITVQVQREASSQCHESNSRRRFSSQRHEGDSELPSEILLARHFQMLRSQIFFARSMSTRWCGVHTFFRDSCIDFKTRGGHWCGSNPSLASVSLPWLRPLVGSILQQFLHHCYLVEFGFPCRSTGSHSLAWASGNKIGKHLSLFKQSNELAEQKNAKHLKQL